MNNVLLGRWSGPIKSSVRWRKIIECGKLEKIEAYLGFPGGEALMEKKLVSQKLVSSGRVVGIQNPIAFRNYDGREVMRVLLESTQEDPFAVYAGDFYRLSSVYGPQFYDDLRRKEKRFGIKGLQSFAEWIVRNGAVRFSVVDADLCCPFHKPAAQAICSLFSQRMVADQGLLFVTHMKGRSKPSDRRLLNVERMTNVSWFGSIPFYYIRQAALVGYVLAVDQIIEYKENKFASPMLQFFFRFKRSTVDRSMHLLPASHSRLRQAVADADRADAGGGNSFSGLIMRRLYAYRA